MRVRERGRKREKEKEKKAMEENHSTFINKIKYTQSSVG